MRILFLTTVYKPDLGAGSFRAEGILNAIVKKMDATTTIDLITTLPSRYTSYNPEANEMDKEGNVTIYRIRIPSHDSGLSDRVPGFWAYAMGVLRIVKNKEYDLVFLTSAKLFTSILGWYIARRKKTVLYIDIRDIFIEALKEIISKKLTIFILPVFRILESIVIRYANGINLVSPGFVPYFKKIRPNFNFSTYTNGIDKEFISHSFKSSNLNSSIKTILYAGNIGEGQGLEKIIPQVAMKLQGRFEFLIIGDGGTKKKLEETLVAYRIQNVKLLSPVSRETLIQYYDNADILFLHLNNYKAFENVLPSKLFEYAATDKPIIAGISGVSAEFAKNNIQNLALFEPCNVEAMVKSIDTLKIESIDRSNFKKQFSRERLMKDFAEEILNTVPKK